MGSTGDIDFGLRDAGEAGQFGPGSEGEMYRQGRPEARAMDPSGAEGEIATERDGAAVDGVGENSCQLKVRAAKQDLHGLTAIDSLVPGRVPTDPGAAEQMTFRTVEVGYSEEEVSAGLENRVGILDRLLWVIEVLEHVPEGDGIERVERRWQGIEVAGKEGDVLVLPEGVIGNIHGVALPAPGAEDFEEDSAAAADVEDASAFDKAFDELDTAAGCADERESKTGGCLAVGIGEVIIRIVESDLLLGGSGGQEEQIAGAAAAETKLAGKPGIQVGERTWDVVSGRLTDGASGGFEGDGGGLARGHSILRQRMADLSKPRGETRG